MLLHVASNLKTDNGIIKKGLKSIEFKLHIKLAFHTTGFQILHNK
jgi:hypothetical protein